VETHPEEKTVSRHPVARALGALFAYDDLGGRDETREGPPAEWIPPRAARIATPVLIAACVAVGWWLIATERVDNKPTVASSGMIGIHQTVSPDLWGWMKDGFWWKGKQTPTPLPYTLIGILFRVFGYDTRYAMALNCALGGLAAWLLARLTRRRFGESAALLGGAFFLLMPLNLFISLSGFTFIWAIAFLLLAVDRLDRFQEDRKTWQYLAAAACLLCAGMSRPEMYAASAVVMCFVRARIPWRVAFLAIVFLYPGAQYIRNNLIFESPVGLRILEDQRSRMTLAQLAAEWWQSVHNLVGNSFSRPAQWIGLAAAAWFGLRRHRFLAALLAYFVVSFFAAYAMRRLSFNHPGYYLSHFTLFSVFLAAGVDALLRGAAWGLDRTELSRTWRISLRTVAGLAAIVALLYPVRVQMANYGLYKADPRLKELRTFVRTQLDPHDKLALDYFMEVTWLMAELESDPGRRVWWYGVMHKPRPNFNPAQPDLPAETMARVNAWLREEYAWWIARERPEYLVTPSDEFHATQARINHVRAYSLRTSFGADNPACLPLDRAGTIVNGDLVYENSAVQVYRLSYPVSKQLLNNADWRTDGPTLPASWKISAAGAVGFDTEQAGGKRIRIAEIRPTAGISPFFTQQVPAEGLVRAGDTLCATVEGRSDDSGKLELNVRVSTADRRVLEYKAQHPGDGEWRPITLGFRLPEDAQPVTIHYSLVLRQGGEQPGYFRYPALYATSK
jgi:hypothetical protein